MSHVPRTALFLSTLLLLCATGAGCGYDCPAKCDDMKEAIADQGRNPADGSNGGMDPETVCDIDEVQEATTCAECEAAIADVYRLVGPGISCDCPEESQLADDPDHFFFYFDESCEQHEVNYTVEGCSEWQSADKHDDPIQCVES